MAETIPNETPQELMASLEKMEEVGYELNKLDVEEALAAIHKFVSHLKDEIKMFEKVALTMKMQVLDQQRKSSVYESFAHPYPPLPHRAYGQDDRQ
jgi:septation ring formation regulator EzrA